MFYLKFFRRRTFLPISLVKHIHRNRIMDPLNVEVYQVESESYRRNVPFEKVNQISQQGHSDFTKLDNEELSDYAEEGCDEKVSVPKESTNDEHEVQQTPVLYQEVIKDDNHRKMQKFEATTASNNY